MDASVITSASTPMGFFILAVLVCNAVFGVCATALKSEKVFLYLIHMFMGVIFFFGCILLWSPGSLYHPAEVQAFTMAYRPWVPTIASFIAVIIYALYQAWKTKRGIPD